MATNNVRKIQSTQSHEAGTQHTTSPREQKEKIFLRALRGSMCFCVDLIARHDANGYHYLLVVFVPLAVYLLTLQNGLTLAELQGGDPITHQYAQATLRFANAPGYPIFTMLGWLWFQISNILSPIFNPIERLALYSTLYAIPSLALLYRLLNKIQHPNPQSQIPTSHYQLLITHYPSLTSLLATLFFAFTYFFWYYAVSPENYSSGVLNTLVMIVLALRWQERRDESALLWLAFVCGLSLAHLLTVALAVPAVILFVLGQQPDYLRRPKLILKAIIAAGLPLLSYGYIYWRGATHPEWRGKGNWPNAWSWFVDFLTTKQGQSELTWNWDGIPTEMVSIITHELTWLVLIGGLIGLFLLPRWRAMLLLGIIAVYAPVMYVDRYGNWFQAIIPLYPVFVIGFVRLIASVSQGAYIKAQSGQPIMRIIFHGWLSISLALLMALVLSKLMGNYPLDNLRNRSTATGLQAGWALLADEPAPNAYIMGTSPENLALDYLTQVWRARPDVRAMGTTHISATTPQPLYVSKAAMPLAQKSLTPAARLSSHGLNLIVVSNEPNHTAPPSIIKVNQTLARGLQLVGYELRRSGEHADFALYWRAENRIEVDLAVSVRLLHDAQPLLREGQVFQVDNAHPVFGFHPMTRWQVGEVVRDDYALPPPLAAQANRVKVLVYRATTTGFENWGDINLPLR
jgi:hypothetical protein